MKTAAQVKLEFEYRGESFSEWASENGYKRGTVYAVLNGHRKAKRGEGHDIAVRLGLKDGVLRDA